MSLITKLTLSISLIGIIILLILANTLPATNLEIENINLNNLNKKISTSGTIIKINNYPNFQILTITKDSFSIDIILDQKTNLRKDQIINVVGKLEKYKNSLQIRAEVIRLESEH